MKNFICGVLFCFCLTLAWACSFSSASSDKLKFNANHLPDISPNVNQSGEIQTSTEKNTVKYPLVLVGSIDLQANKVEITENQVWTDGRDGKDIQDAKETDFLPTAIGEEVEVDVMNCAGFIVKGKAVQESEDGGWKLKPIPQTLAADASEKIRQCAPPIYSPEDTSVTGFAFAVAPANNNRRNIKTGKTDPKKLFASLPKATQVWADGNTKEPGRKKGTLSLNEDNWSDIDGDGKIDLVVVYGSCQNDEFSCGSLLFLINGKWKEIGYFVPA